MTPSRGLRALGEGRVRRAWSGEPGGLLRLASAGYGFSAGVRNLLYDSGFLAAHRAPIPVVSVGGLTVGGSGKTPLAADIAARLAGAGVRTAILTHGFADELAVHERLAPTARLYGGRNRARLACRAADEGADLAIVDSGFQHRRMSRDLDIVAVNVDSDPARQLSLPAGIYREGLRSLSRADLVVMVSRSGRETGADRPDGRADRIGTWLRTLREVPDSPSVVSAEIRPGRLVSANPSAEKLSQPGPSVAVAGIMWPEVFFRQVQQVAPTIEQALSLPDHGRIGGSLPARLRSLAGAAGLACTLKDAGKLVEVLGDSVPIWYLAEEVVWKEPPPQPRAVRMALALIGGATSRSSQSP